MNIQALLSEKVSQALIAAGAPADCEPQVRQSAKVQFGDYQANGVMAVAKKLGMAPRQLAEQVLSHLDLNGIANKVEIAGPGFINIFLDPAFLADNVNRALQSERLGVTKPQVQTIVVDYSAPNVAKEMHVGHLRSTIIGDASVRTLEFLGHKVIRANHVGDWGTQFGMLIAYLEKQQQENAGEMALADLEGFYREAKKHYDEDEAFAERARSYVVKLQGGDEYFLQMWRKLVDITMSQNQITYDRLNVTLTRDDVMGESLYNPMLPGIVGVTNVIPFFGPFIGAVPSFIIVVLQNPVQGLYFLIFIFILQQIDGNIIGPKILGDSTGITPFWVVTSILIFGGLWGFPGMLLGVPVMAVLQYIVRNLLDYALKKRGLVSDTASYVELVRVDKNTNELVYPGEEKERKKEKNT